MVLDAADRLADLTGWVTVDNKSGATYRNAALKLVAGDVHRAQDQRRNARALEVAAKAAPYGMPISNQKVGVHLEIRNSQENRLGVPLPKGKVRVYKADRSGSQQFIGEDWIDHTYEVEWEISLRNHKKEAQTVTVIEPVPGDRQVLTSTHQHEKVEAHTLKCEIPVPKESEAKPVYRVRIRYSLQPYPTIASGRTMAA